MRGWLLGLLLISTGCGSEVVGGRAPHDEPERAPDPIPGTGGAGGGPPVRDPGGGGGGGAATVGWSPVDGLSGCSSHTATALEDGSVLVVGACATSDGTAAGAGLVDPGSRKFASLPAPAVRMGHTATRLGSGSVLVAGGLDATSGAALGASWIYEPGTGFAEADALEHPRFGHAASLLDDGRVVLFGGALGDAGTSWVGSGISSSTELVSIDGGALGSTASLVEARSAHATAPFAGSVLAIGGMAWDHELASVERFDGTTWLPVPSLPYALGQPAALALPDGRVFVVASEGALLFDGIGWTPTASAGVPTYLAAAVATLGDGSLLVVSSAIYSFGCHVLRYRIALDLWEAVEPGPITCGGSTVTATSLADGRALVVSGSGAAIYELGG